MAILHLDDETRSAVELKSAGLDNYARHASTGLWCSAFAFDDDSVQLWTPEGSSDDAAVRAAKEHISRGGIVVAHHAAFELAIGVHVATRYGWPALKQEQMRCTMATAYSMGLPGSLDGAAAALGIDQRKDEKGSRVMMQLARPRKVADDGTITWWDDPVKLEILYNYCEQDVKVERALHKRMRELSLDEQELWFLDQRINARGIKVDLPSIDRATALVNAEKARLDQAMRDTTGNVVAGCTDVAQLTAWLRYKGVSTEGVAKAHVIELMSRDDLPVDCRKALELRQAAAKSSTAKLTAMAERAGPDGRMRGLFQYHGAATGRWAGRGPQLHNYPRPIVLHDQNEIEDVIANFDSARYLDMMYGEPMQLVSDCLRGMLIADEGKEFVCCDYSNIEGRVLAWLAGEDWKVRAFEEYDEGIGPDMYLLAYARGFSCSIEEAKPHRQIGKVMELALGYGGGVGAFQTMARGYGVKVSNDRAEELKQAWRRAHKKVVSFWYALEEAAIRAVQEGSVHRARGIAFKVSGSFLWCQLPSKRLLCYPYPQIGEGTFGNDALTYMAVNGVTRKWERCATYGGSLAENVTQAVARDILVAGIRNCEAAGYPVVMHVHDEIVAEVPLHEKSVDEMTSLMSNTPHWAAGLPVAAAGWSGQRYRKD